MWSRTCASALCAVIVASIGQAAFSASPALATAAEIRGITLGVDVASFPRCSGKVYDKQFTEGPCFRPADPNETREPYSTLASFVENLPRIAGLGTVAAVEVDDGRIETVDLPFASENFGLMLQALTSKYGRPDGTETRTLQNGSGHVRSSRSAYWGGAAGLLRIEELEPGGGNDYGHIRLFSAKRLQQLKAQRNGALKNLKGKL